MKPIDLTGQRFGRWTVTGRATNHETGQARWSCRCDCGGTRVLKSIVLRKGLSRSCGCLKLEVLAERSTKHGHSPAARVSPTYNTWAGMIARCTNPNHANYACYGGRGIKVCPRWLTFATFLKDMGEKPEGRTLDRRDNAGNYEPGNCIWATAVRQANNKRNNRRIEFQGHCRTASEWADITGMPASAISDRIRAGWSAADALTKPTTGHRTLVTISGETRSVAQWAKHLGINAGAVYQRIARGWKAEDALTTAATR